MPAPLQAPHIPSDFPPLATVDGQIVRPGGLTAPEMEASAQTVSPDGQTTTLGHPTTKTYTTPLSPASLISVPPPRAAPTTLAVPHTASSTPAAPPVAPAS
jgi:hypothetical protein